MNYRMNRVQMVLSGLLALLLALVVGFLFLVHAGQSMGPNQEAPTGQFDAAPSPPPPPLTAREGYRAALPTARAWSEDAQLWRAQTTWSAGTELQAPPPAWNFTFYSSSRQATALIITTVESTTLVRTRPVASAPALVAVESWLVDSPAAFDLLHESGGEAFLTIHPRRTMMLTLHAAESLRWQAILIDEGPIGNAAGRQIFTLVFSAQDGRLITTSLEGDTHEES